MPWNKNGNIRGRDGSYIALDDDGAPYYDPNKVGATPLLENDARYYTETEVNTLLSAKAPTDSPTFTGTVSGVTKTHVGLANVDNVRQAPYVVDPSTAWTAMTLTNGWVNFGGQYQTARYRRTISGEVSIQGLIKGSGATNNTFFTLPTGFRPAATLFVPAVANAAVGAYDIYSDGRMIFALGSSTDYLTINFTFYAG